MELQRNIFLKTVRQRKKNEKKLGDNGTGIKRGAGMTWAMASQNPGYASVSGDFFSDLNPSPVLFLTNNYKAVKIYRFK
jgi:hypothetical protein